NQQRRSVSLRLEVDALSRRPRPLRFRFRLLLTLPESTCGMGLRPSSTPPGATSWGQRGC
ncbi:unnamed protein product, partial [Tenebrio molitor]